MKLSALRLATALSITLASSAAISACQPTTPSDDQIEADAWGYRGNGTKMFLSEHGLGSREESLAYYSAVLKGGDSSSFTLEKWKTQFLNNAPTTTALYRNSTELGFWREMTCTQLVARGVGGCTVTNWNGPTDKSEGLPNKGTVAMNVSAEGITRFYAFLPDGRLSPTVVLDSEGPKSVPRACTVCHSGSNPTPGERMDLGSVFREFEPHLLEARPGVSRVVAEQEWFRLNRIVQQANLAIRSEGEGAPFGTDHAKQAINDRIETLYIPGGQPDALPESWANADAASQELWHKVIVPYCLSCHRHNAWDWTNYKNLEYFRSGDIKQYLPEAPDPNADVGAMPQAALTFEILKNDRAAKDALATWLGENQPTKYTIGGNGGAQLGPFYVDDDMSLSVNGAQVFRDTPGNANIDPIAFDAAPGDVVTIRFFDTFGGGRENHEIWFAGPGTPMQKVGEAYRGFVGNYVAMPNQPFNVISFKIPAAGGQATTECLPTEALDTSWWPRVPNLQIREATSKRYRARWNVNGAEYDFTASCDGWIGDTFISGADQWATVQWNTITNQIRTYPSSGHPYNDSIARAAAGHAQHTLFPGADMASLVINP